MAERERPTADRYGSLVPPEPPPQVDQTFKGGTERKEYLHGTAFRPTPPLATKGEVESGHHVAAVGEPMTAAEMTAAAPATTTQRYGVPEAKVSDRYPTVSTEETVRGWIRPKK